MFNIASNALMVLFLVIPFATAIRLMLKKNLSITHWLLWFMLSSMACYVAVRLCVSFAGMHLRAELYRFDLDNNGLFSPEESTPEMEKAMKAYTHDTGRSFAPITGLITSPLYVAICHALIGLPYVLWNLIRREPAKEGHAQANGQ